MSETVNPYDELGNLGAWVEPPMPGEEQTSETKQGIRVTATDLANPEDTSTVEIMDDYALTCAGSCYVDNVQAYGNGTQVITIKGRRSR